MNHFKSDLGHCKKTNHFKFDLCPDLGLCKKKTNISNLIWAHFKFDLGLCKKITISNLIWEHFKFDLRLCKKTNHFKFDREPFQI